MNQLTKNIILMAGDLGKQWLESLPSLVAFYAEKWQLTHLVLIPNLSYNYVLTGYRINDGKKIVLKLSFFKYELSHEAAALRIYNGNGCVTLLEADSDRGALLLEYISPGTSLKALFPDNDGRAVAHAVSVMQRLHTQPIADVSKFPTIQNWLSALDHPQTQLITKKHLDRARDISADLLQSQEPFVLLHGDLHHDNILASNRDGSLAIDPKGLLGPRAYEVGAYICNPVPTLLEQTDPTKIIAGRLELFADLMQLDQQLLRDWSYVHAVLAACWSAKDGNGLEYFVSCAERIVSPKP